MAGPLVRAGAVTSPISAPACAVGDESAAEPAVRVGTVLGTAVSTVPGAAVRAVSTVPGTAVRAGIAVAAVAANSVAAATTIVVSQVWRWRAIPP